MQWSSHWVRVKDGGSQRSDALFWAVRLRLGGVLLTGNFPPLDSLLHGELFTEPLQWVSALELLQFDRRMLVQELVDAKVSSAHSH